MTTQIETKLNRLERLLPEGLIVDARWLESHGYSTALRSHYVSAGWLSQPARRVYQRPRGRPSWHQIVISLQTLLGRNLIVGGKTALDLQGYAHYVSATEPTVYLYGPEAPPTWLNTIDAKTTFAYRNDARLFETLRKVPLLDLDAPEQHNPERSSGYTTQPWGHWNWQLVLSTPERAILEWLDELPDHDSFHHADMVMEGLANLSPAVMQAALEDCHSVKVKRIFFFLADRHSHAWLKRLNKKAVDLGSGKRMLTKGGRFDPTYQITVPGDLDGPG